jgi:1-deoxy-D-xylulose-5-phosphate synthase
MVLHYLANSGQLDGRVSLRTLTLPDRFIDHASPEVRAHAVRALTFVGATTPAPVAAPVAAFWQGRPQSQAMNGLRWLSA